MLTKPLKICKLTKSNHTRAMERTKKSNRAAYITPDPVTVEPVPTPTAAPPPEPPISVAMPIPNGLIAGARQLIYHVCQLCNIITCGMSAYLSIESLCRDMLNNKLPNHAYMGLLSHEADVLHDISFKLSLAADALLRTPEHASNMQSLSYRALLDAATRLPRFTAWIPAAQFKRMPFQEEVLEIRHYAGLAAVMMDGNPTRGVAGWKECWDDASPHDIWHTEFGRKVDNGD